LTVGQGEKVKMTGSHDRDPLLCPAGQMRNYPNCNCQELSENITEYPEAAGRAAGDKFFALLEDGIRSTDGGRMIAAIKILASLALAVPALRERIDKTFWVINLTLLVSPDGEMRSHALRLADTLIFLFELPKKSNWEVEHVVEAHFREVNENATMDCKVGCLGFCRAMVECGYSELVYRLIDNDVANDLLELIEDIEP
jgi:hypothetical protein